MTKSKGVVVSSFITTGSTLDTYATHIDTLGKGGYRCVETLIARDAITIDRQSVGMLCYVLENNKIYILATDGWKPLLVDGTPILPEPTVLPTLPMDYILAGDYAGRTISSPLLKHLRLDIIALRQKTAEVDFFRIRSNQCW